MNQHKKMYICILAEFPDYMAPTLVGHAVLRHHLAKNGTPVYDDWLANSFKKCVVRVNQREFEKIKTLPDVVESWENNTLGGNVSCLTIVASSTEHNVLKFAKLWKPTNE